MRLKITREHKSRICFNNLLLNEVNWFVDSKHERSGKPDYEILGNPGELDRDPLFTCRFLLLAIRNRLVDKLVERCALLGGADGSHDWIPYDVAILIDDIRCREREQI